MPGGSDELVSSEFEVWVAGRVVEQHVGDSLRADGGRGCAQCPPTGPCRLHAWAERRLAMVSARASS